jgi:hypothetical protein
VLAIAAVPTARLFVTSGQLAIVPVSMPRIFGKIALLYLRGRELQPKDALFLQCAMQVAAEHEGSYMDLESDSENSVP